LAPESAASARNSNANDSAEKPEIIDCEQLLNQLRALFGPAE
jgi:hypothetical protein